jgi:aspartokinase/homoserine dehydrogenase 1
MRVLCFTGGGSVRAERLRWVVDQLRRERGAEGLLAVVAAPAVVRAELTEAVRQAAAGDGAYEDTSARVLERFRSVAAELIGRDDPEALEQVLVDFEERAADLRDLLHSAFLLRDGGDRLTDGVLAQGELAVARLVAVALGATGVVAELLDPRPLVVSDGEFGGARIDPAATRTRLATLLPGGVEVLVIAGGVAATSSGETTSLGPDGVVASAAVLAATVGASRLDLWLDGASGLELAPVPAQGEARSLTFGELAELAGSSFPVVALEPADRAGLVVSIHDFAAPSEPPVRVDGRAPAAPGGLRGLAVEPSLALLRIEGDRSRFDTGLAARLLASLAFAGIEARAIVRGAREAALTVAVGARDAARARRVVGDELEVELQSGQMRVTLVAGERSALVAVGEGLGERPETLAAVLRAVAREGAEVATLALGGGGRSLTVLVDRQRLASLVPAVQRELAALHGPRRLRLALAGDGRVARALLTQLQGRRAALAAAGLELDVVARWTSRRRAFDPAGLDPARWTDELPEGKGDPEGLRTVLAAGRELPVLVDLTASEAVPALYASWLGAGSSVVAANKRAFAGPLERWRAILAAAESGGAELRHEATVGAGLPVVSTLEDLVATGDRLHRIDAVLSGTVSFVLDRVGAGVALSDAVREAHEAGLTEPHPAEDLAGTDVARKLVILARRAGVELELDQVTVESLAPGAPGQPHGALEDFWRALPTLDEALAERARSAQAEGRRLRYVARLDLGEPGRGAARVAVEAVSSEHPAHGLAGPDNLIAFFTDRYRSSPLVVRGPGAGPEVTAAGVFADLLRVASRPPRSARNP